MKIWGVTVLLLLVSAVTCDEEQNKEKGIERKKKHLIAKYSTRTHVTLTTITSTALLTCQLVVPNSATCKKRRRKRANKMLEIEDKSVVGTEINPSSDITPENNTEEGDSASKREGRLKIVFWSTVTSLYTLTSTSINRGMTFSISFFCNVGGASYPPLCG